VRLLPPQAAEQSAKRRLHLHALPLYMLDVENSAMHNILVAVCKGVGLSTNRMEDGEEMRRCDVTISIAAVAYSPRKWA
jgi:hypothetical protein